MENNSIFIEKLRSSGLRPTKHRIKICKLLFDRKKTFHFTINDLSKILNKEIREKVSLATIYNCLNKFVSVGLLKQIDQQGEVTIFDTNVSHHHHFLNQNTGELIDIDPDEIGFSKLPDIPNGFESDGVEVLIKIKE